MSKKISQSIAIVITKFELKTILLFWIIFLIIGYIKTPPPQAKYTTTALIKVAKLKGELIMQPEEILREVNSNSNLLAKGISDSNTQPSEPPVEIIKAINTAYFNKSTAYMTVSLVNNDRKLSALYLGQLSENIINHLNSIARPPIKTEMEDFDRLQKLASNALGGNCNGSDECKRRLDVSDRYITSIMAIQNTKVKLMPPYTAEFSIAEKPTTLEDLSEFSKYKFRIFFISLVGIVLGYLYIKIKNYINALRLR
jgi:hypothetical protein